MLHNLPETKSEHPSEKLTIVGDGIIGALEAYYDFIEARKIGKRKKYTVRGKGHSHSETTTSNIVPSLTPDEILSVVPRGSALIEKLKIPFDQPGGIRVDDVKGVHESISGARFIKEALEYSRDDGGHRERTETLMNLGKMSMDAWQAFYDEADAELKKILEESNFKPCREPTSTEKLVLRDGYRIDLIYNVPDAKKRADGMKQDYEKLGYKFCKVLSPSEVMAMDPSLADFCMSNSEIPDEKEPKNRVWKNNAVALYRPGGCIDTHVFLPKFYAYLAKLMGTYKNKDGKVKNRFRIKFDSAVTGVVYDEKHSKTEIVGLQLPTKVKKNKHTYVKSDYVFAPGEAVGTLERLGFTEPAYARFAGPSLLLNIPFDASKLDSNALQRIKEFNHCMEVHQEGVVLAWQGRSIGDHIFIGVAGTKAFYANQEPTKDQAFAKNRNLLQLNIINDVLPEFISLALGKDTKGKKLTQDDLDALEKNQIAKRWVGSRAVAYDGFPTVGDVFNAHGKVTNARVTTGLGSGGVSFSHGAIKASRSTLDEKADRDPITQKVIQYGRSVRTMFVPIASTNIEFKRVAEKLVKSEMKVTVSSIEGSHPKGINDLISEAKKADKPIIFTFTPGPFKLKDELPKDWMETPAAVGCTPQLTAFDNEMKKLNAVIYAVNKQSSAYQCGASGLLAAKKFNNLQMISDEDGALAKELGLPTFAVGDKQYLSRFSVVIKPNGDMAVFELSSPVNDQKAKEHVDAIDAYINPSLEKHLTGTATATAAKR